MNTIPKWSFLLLLLTLFAVRCTRFEKIVPEAVQYELHGLQVDNATKILQYVRIDPNSGQYKQVGEELKYHLINQAGTLDVDRGVFYFVAFLEAPRPDDTCVLVGVDIQTGKKVKEINLPYIFEMFNSGIMLNYDPVSKTVILVAMNSSIPSVYPHAKAYQWLKYNPDDDTKSTIMVVKEISSQLIGSASVLDWNARVEYNEICTGIKTKCYYVGVDIDQKRVVYNESEAPGTFFHFYTMNYGHTEKTIYGLSIEVDEHGGYEFVVAAFDTKTREVDFKLKLDPLYYTTVADVQAFNDDLGHISVLLGKKGDPKGAFRIVTIDVHAKKVLFDPIIPSSAYPYGTPMALEYNVKVK